ncbi:uncharacterized protein [Malus domestica]|uniref:uncharacterized protein n=1 Tax=Malus domestica TaxID=3750 RepID=UPI003976D187
MRIICWNCQGIGGDLTVDDLLEQNRLHTTDIVVLLEMKDRSPRYAYLKWRIGLDYMHAVEPKGIGRRLCIFWKDYNQVLLVKYSDFFIEVGIHDDKVKKWRFFAVYASTDVGLASNGWLGVYPEAITQHEVLEGSDHAMLVLYTEDRMPFQRNRFMYDLWWSKEVGCMDIIKKSWERNFIGSRAFQVMEKLKQVRHGLRKWYRQRGRNSKGRIETLKKELRIAYKSKCFAGAEEGDKNTKFFHAQMVKRRRSNRIRGLEDDNAVWWEDLAKVKDMAGEYFVNLFTTSNPRWIQEVTEWVDPRDHWEMVGGEIILMVQVSGIQMHPAGEDQYLAMKLDMAKAYDRVEWSFLLAMIRKLGFCEECCKRIEACISIVTYSVLINGLPNGYIQQQRGLRQGNLMSPFLFLICAEGYPGGLPIFCQALVLEVQGVLEVLDCYADGSRQFINREKCSLFFGANCSKRQRKTIGQWTNIQDKDGFGKNLGLLADFGHSKRAVFEEVRKGMDARFNGWAEQYLS